MVLRFKTGKVGIATYTNNTTFRAMQKLLADGSSLKADNQATEIITHR